MRLPIIKAIALNDSISQSDLTITAETLEAISAARGLTDEELDAIGELISNIEGAKIVIEDNRHYGTPLREALNKFMKRVINSIS
jgi:hypothetical protein